MLGHGHGFILRSVADQKGFISIAYACCKVKHFANLRCKLLLYKIKK